MTVLLTILVLISAVVALWQITRMFEIATNKDVENTEIANDEDNKRNGKLLFAFLVFIYGLMIFTSLKWGHVILGKGASEHADQYDMLMDISFVLLFVVQILTQALLFFFGYKYRGKKENKALYYADNDKLEFIWTIIPVITLAGLILYGLWTWTNIMDVNEKRDNPMVIELYAQQFNWKVRYAGADNVLGDANVRFIPDYDGKNLFGVDGSDPNAMDDVLVTSELHLPVNRKILLKMRSQDVLHSAYLPHFRVQMNCVPGMITQFGFTPTVTTDEMRLDPDIIEKVKRTNKIRDERRLKGEDLEPWEFDYTLVCNKICGTSHYKMRLKVIVESEEEYQAWLKTQTTFKQMIASE